MTTRTTHRPRMADHVAMDTAYELGVAQQQLVDMEQRLAPRPLRKQVMDLLGIGAIAVMILLVYWFGEWRGFTAAGGVPLPTAGFVTATQRPLPTSQEPAAEQRQEGNTAPAAQQPVVAPLPAWPDDAGGPDLQLQAVPDGEANEEAINAWLNAPASTPTPTRSVVEVVSDATFDASFVDPGCSPFVGYLPGDPCIEILKQQGGE